MGKMILRYQTWILGAMLLGLVVLACATAKPPAQEYTPSFSYDYPRGEASATDVTMALVRPSYKVQAQPSPFSMTAPAEHAHMVAFRTAMATQLEEMLSQKGLRVTGPYDDLDSMTFPDKKGADLTLTPEVAVNIKTPAVKQALKATLMGNVPVWQTQGECIASGFVSFVIIEPLSGEKMWLKKVDVPAQQVPCSAEHEDQPEVQKAIDNGVAKVLEQAYRLVMEKACAYLSPEEITLLKTKGLELREKKVY